MQVPVCVCEREADDILSRYAGFGEDTPHHLLIKDTDGSVVGWVVRPLILFFLILMVVIHVCLLRG